MAKPISFTKRDLEKKKQEKRLAKQQKKEERKSNGTSSFEDMIAYVDENGMITDTPPHHRKKYSPGYRHSASHNYQYHYYPNVPKMP